MASGSPQRGFATGTSLRRSGHCESLLPVRYGASRAHSCSRHPLASSGSLARACRAKRGMAASGSMLIRSEWAAWSTPSWATSAWLSRLLAAPASSVMPGREASSSDRRLLADEGTPMSHRPRKKEIQRALSCSGLSTWRGRAWSRRLLTSGSARSLPSVPITGDSRTRPSSSWAFAWSPTLLSRTLSIASSSSAGLRAALTCASIQGTQLPHSSGLKYSTMSLKCSACSGARAASASRRFLSAGSISCRARRSSRIRGISSAGAQATKSRNRRVSRLKFLSPARKCTRNCS
mmetsp:Transcript_13793/g.39049  ORF Transcript_13793/g.39049 Transcript_13793/m.39049 type:complete len:292 (+) Transcript_13793:631-1506(+)